MKLLNWYRWLNGLSIDVAIGATVCAAFFLKISSLSIRPESLTALGLTVWIIYTMDHLKDVYHLKKIASTDRHRIHQQNFKSLFLFMVAAIIIVIFLLFKMRFQMLIWGISLSVAVLIYVTANRYLRSTKELVGALLYCTGVFLPSISRVDSIVHFLFSMDCAIFFLLVLSNLLLFSWYDVDQDKEDNRQSFAVSFGKPMTRTIIILLLILSSTLLVPIWIYGTMPNPICFTFMNGCLILITVFPDYFKQENRYRYLGDFVFIIPSLAL